MLLLDPLLPASEHRTAAHLAQHSQVVAPRFVRHRPLPVSA
jgi:hypothetical protein